METFLGSMITIFVVSVVMGLLTKCKLDKKTSSIYKFTVRASSAIMFIAVATMAIPAALLVANFLQGDRTVSVYVCGGIFFALGLFLLIQTIPGANDILVDCDDITVRLAWFYKRHWSFSQIDYATADHNGLHVFVKGRKRRAFVVDNMFNGMANFSKRLEHDGIEIRSKAMTLEQLEKSKKMWNRISWLVVVGIVLVCAIVYIIA